VRRFAAATATLVVALLFCAVLLEVGVLVALGPQARFPRRVVGSEFGLRINEPGARYWHRSPDVAVEFRINGKGLRDDRELAYEKPAGVRRIVSLGDSFTAGYEVQGEETFSAALERALRARGIEVEVLNAGVSGYSTAEAALYLERELFRYEPDLVLVSFFGNDLVDNTRTGLFRLENGALVQTADAYVPGGGLGDFLNTNPFFNWLSERSNAFVLAKEVLTTWLKRRVVAENLDHVAGGDAPAAADDAVKASQRALAAALFERIYAATRERGVPLVIQSIPTPVYPQGPPDPEGRDLRPGQVVLLDLFPLAEFDVHRPGLLYVPIAPVLEPFADEKLLYYLRSHSHWTPFAHELDGTTLADRIVAAGLLEPTPN
jgi:lysophospholipase L1-like esterase